MAIAAADADACFSACAGPGARFLRSLARNNHTRRRGAAVAATSEATAVSQEARAAELKKITISLTIVVPTEDINPQIFEAASEYLRDRCLAGSISTERGGAFKHLHIQGVLS